MTKKQQQKIGIAIFIAIAMVILISQGVIFQKTLTTTLLVESVTADFSTISNSAELNNKFFRIVSSVGRGLDEIVGSIQDSNFNYALASKGIDAWKTEFDLSFSAKILKEEAKYPIIPETGNPSLFKTYSVQRQIDPGVFSSPPPCVGDQIIFNRDFPSSDRFCIVANIDGRFGGLEDPTIQTDIDFSMTRAGSTVNRVISNIGTDSGTKELYDSSGSLVGRVRLSQVSESAGANPPTSSNYKTLFIDGQGWKLLTSSDVGTYKNLRDITDSIYIDYSVIESTCASFTSESRNTCIENELNKKIQGVKTAQLELQTTQETFSGGSMFFENKALENGAKIRYIPSQTQLTEPRLLLDVQAEWIGVRELVSKPKITSIECPDFKQNGYIKVVVLNEGDVESNFNVKLDSCGDFDQLSSVKAQSIFPQGTGTFLITIDSEGIADIETCRVTAFNIGLSETLSDTQSVTCKALDVGLCDDGDQLLTSIGGQTCVKVCASGVFPTEPEFCCEPGEIASPTLVDGKIEYKCESGDVTTVSCESCFEYAKSKIFGSTLSSQQCRPKTLQTNTTCVLGFLQLALIPLTFIFALLFGLQFIQKLKGMRNKSFKTIATISVLLISIILTALVFYLFTLGIIIVIGYLAFTIILGAIKPPFLKR